MSFAPLDPDEYKRQAVLLKAIHCAHPVMYQGKSAFIQVLRAGANGGSIEMEVYLAGKSEPVRVDEITLQPQPE